MRGAAVGGREEGASYWETCPSSLPSPTARLHVDHQGPPAYIAHADCFYGIISKGVPCQRCALSAYWGQACQSLPPHPLFTGGLYDLDHETREGDAEHRHRDCRLCVYGNHLHSAARGLQCPNGCFARKAEAGFDIVEPKVAPEEAPDPPPPTIGSKVVSGLVRPEACGGTRQRRCSLGMPFKDQAAAGASIAINTLKRDCAIAHQV